MKTALIILSVFVSLLIIGSMVIGLTYVSYSNQEINLREAINAKQKDSKVIFDKSWKIVQKTAGVTDRYADQFRKVYNDIMTARYDNKNGDRGALFNFVTEANPNFNERLYEKLVDEIKEQQEDFTLVQQELISISQEHRKYIRQFPASFFIGGRGDVEIQLVTSTRTEDTFKTGLDDNTNVF